MDFTNRNTQTPAGGFPSAPQPGNSFGKKEPEKKKPLHKLPGQRRWLQWGGGIFFLCVVVLAVAVIGLIAVFNPSESKFVNKDRYQAVFLTNGQVYFGKIKDVTGQYLDLRNVYYLRQEGDTSSKTANNNLTLVKLGCEIHAPEDQMVIKSNQISFWENIKPDGQVAQKIGQIKDCTSNPAGSPEQSNTGGGVQTPSGADKKDSNTPTSAGQNSGDASNSANTPASNPQQNKPTTP